MKMSPSPTRSHWEEKTLGSFCTFFSGGTPSRSKPEYFQGEIPFIGSGDIYNSEVEQFITELALNESSAKMVEKGDILYALYGANSGEVAISKIRGAVNQAVLCIRTNQNKIFLKNLLQFRRENILSRYLQGGQGNLSAAIVKKMKVSLPPLPEQRKIAQILSTWDEAIETLEKLIAAKEKLKKGLMQQLLTGKKRLPGFEGEWEMKRLDEALEYRRGSFPQPYGLEKWYDDENGFPFVQVYDVSDDLVLKNSTKRRISSLAAEQSVFVPKGTIVITIQGSIGRVAITNYDAYVDRTLLIVTGFKIPMDALFLATVLERLFEIEKAKAPGGTIKTITKEALSKFKINIPPIEEQIAIAKVLQTSIEDINLTKTKLKLFVDQKKGLMQQLLTGKTRVKV